MKRIPTKASMFLLVLVLLMSNSGVFYAAERVRDMNETLVVDDSYTGMVKNEYGWCYVKNGKLDTSYTGMAKNQYGWWYMENGKLDTSYTGMAKNQYGWWYMKNGKLDTSYTGMAKNQYGWWYMKNGKLDTSYTGMAKNQYGWWYMKNGKLDTSYTGMTKNQYGWWYMKNGKLDTSYTGLASNEYGTWYMENGKLNTSYSGSIEFENKQYWIENGKVSNVDYAVNLPLPTLTGIDVKDFIAVAKSQLGYTESETNQTIYADWAGQNGRAWCSEFAAWCANKAGISTDIIPVGTSSNKYRMFFANAGQYYLIDNGQDNEQCGCGSVTDEYITIDEIEPGDILLVTTSSHEYSEGPNHTCICVEVKDGIIYTIEGNYNGMVSRGKRNAEFIHGVCKPDFSGR